MISKQDLIRDVRIILDENESGNSLVATFLEGTQEDSTQLSIDAIIAKSIPGALRYVCTHADTELLGEGQLYRPTDYDGEFENVHVTVFGADWYHGRLHIGDEVLRVLSVKVPSWIRSVTKFTEAGSDDHNKQYSRFAGVRASVEDPVAVVTTSKKGWCIDMFPTASDESYEYCRVIPDIDGDLSDSADIETYVSKRLLPALTYCIASFTCASLNDPRTANFKAICDSLLEGDSAER